MCRWEGKKYKLDKSGNFDEYTKALGVGFITRKMANTLSPTIELVKDGEFYKLKTMSSFKSYSIKFQIGEEFDEETMDGRNVKTTFLFEGENKLIQVQKGSPETKIIREFTETELIATMIIENDNVKCVRTYTSV